MNGAHCLSYAFIGMFTNAHIHRHFNVLICICIYIYSTLLRRLGGLRRMIKRIQCRWSNDAAVTIVHHNRRIYILLSCSFSVSLSLTHLRSHRDIYPLDSRRHDSSALRYAIAAGSPAARPGQSRATAAASTNADDDDVLALRPNQPRQPSPAIPNNNIYVYMIHHGRCVWHRRTAHLLAADRDLWVNLVVHCTFMRYILAHMRLVGWCVCVCCVCPVRLWFAYIY